MAAARPVRAATPPRRAAVAAALGAALALVALTVLGAGAPARAASDPAPTARAALAVELTSGRVVHAEAADTRRPIASLTKLMTALVTLERLELDDRVRAVDYDALPVESVAGLRAGERLTVRDLVTALLLASANDAAETLAVGVAGSRERFVGLMNRRARELGMARTRFANPIGLDDPGAFSTARDLVTLVRALRRDRFFREVVDRPRAELESGARDRTVLNRNRLVREVDDVDGVKTGRTLGAGWSLVASARREGLELVSVVLGASSESARDREALALLDLGARRLRRETAVRGGAQLALASADRGEGEPLAVGLRAQRSSVHVLDRGERLRVDVRGPATLEGPLPRGRRVGTATVRLGRRVLDRVPLVTAQAVPAPPADGGGGLPGGATLALVAVAVLAGALLALRRRAVRRSRRTRRRRPAGTEAA